MCDLTVFRYNIFLRLCVVSRAVKMPELQPKSWVGRWRMKKSACVLGDMKRGLVRIDCGPHYSSSCTYCVVVVSVSVGVMMGRSVDEEI